MTTGCPGRPSNTARANPVPEAVKEERWARLMELQQPISLRKNQAQVHTLMDVLVEGVGESTRAEPLLLGRSYRDAPEVDGLVLIPGVRDVAAGNMLQVRITGAMEYDLVGERMEGETFRSTRDTIDLVG